MVDKYILFKEKLIKNNDKFKKNEINLNDYISCICIEKCIINFDGFLTSNLNENLTFDKWYNKRKRLPISIEFQKESVLSLIQIWNNVFQHITFDTLPKLDFIQKVLDYDKECKIMVMNNLQKDLLNTYLKIEDNKFIVRDKNVNYFVKRGYYINCYNSNNLITKMGDFGYNLLSNYFIKNNIYSYNHSNELKYLIYISRYGNKKRSINKENEEIIRNNLKKISDKHNLIYFETNNPQNNDKFKNIFSLCKILITVHGGALGNIIYLNKNSKVLEIIPRNKLIERPCFYFLSNSLNLKYINFEPENFDFNRNYVKVNIPNLIENIDLLLK